MPRTGDLARRLAVARGDEPADLVVRGGRVLSVFTREWLDVDVAICDGVIAGLGSYDGTETLDAAGAYVVPGFIDAHLHLETSKLLPSEFARLVLPLGHDGRRRRPARDRERPRYRRRPLARRRLRGPAAGHLLHRLLVCPGLRLRVAAAAVHPRRPREPPAPEAGNRPGRDDELPRRDLRRAERAGQAGGRGRGPRRRTCAGSARARSAGLRLSRDRLRPRGLHSRGRAGAAAGGNVAPDPGGIRCAEPSRARAARRRVRSVADGVLHRRPRAGAHRRGRSHQRDGARRGLVRRRGRGRAGHGVTSSGSLARARRSRGDRARLPGRSAAAARPRAVRARDRAEARPGGPGDHADGGAGVGDAERADPAGRRRGLPGAVGGRPGEGDRAHPGADRHRGARRGVAGGGRARACRSFEAISPRSP